MKLIDILYKAGFRGEGLKMAYAIAMAESSGNARAHNGNAGTGDNSYGLFQINMLGAMGPERRRRYGLSSNEDLFDPLTNAKIAFKMSNGGKNWGPWSTYGNGMYRQYYGGSGASVGNSSDGYWTGSGYAGTKAVTPSLSMEELAEKFGLTASLVNSNKELKNLFKEAVAGDWGATTQGQLRFQARLKNTKWWRGQSSTLRKYIVTKFEDPATWKQQQGAALAKLNQLGIQVGLTNQLVGGKPTALLKKVAYWSTALGWSDERIKNYLGGFVGTHDGVMWGEAGEAWDKLHALSYTNGVSYSWQWYRDRSREIVAGKTTQETVEAKIRNAAAAQYSAFRDQILAGQNVIDLAAPYIKTVSQLLELPEADVDVFNRHVHKAMTTKTTSSAEGGSQMPLWQFENEVRDDPLWRKTNNARESMMTVAHQVAKDFGLAY